MWGPSADHAVGYSSDCHSLGICMHSSRNIVFVKIASVTLSVTVVVKNTEFNRLTEHKVSAPDYNLIRCPKVKDDRWQYDGIM